jgi:serine/threonine protein kinase
MSSVASKKKKIFDGRYEVLSIVGRGACSVVYHAKNVSSPSTEVALKVLINQQGGTSSTDRLRKEALAMVSSRHKYVIRLDDFHSVQDLCYLSMEYAKEGDLRKYSSKLGGKLSVQQAHAFFRQTAEALNFVHRVGITHRDIKPDNILVLNDREIRLTDFGVAVLPGEQASLDDLQQGVGTMSYMAPEVLEGKNCDKVSDIYSLGVSFYEILSATHPFENAPLIKQLEVRGDNNFPHISKLVPNIPKQFADVIMRCMRYQPDKRFLSMNDLLKALNEFPDTQEEKAPAQKPAAKKEPEAKRTPRIATKVSGRKTKAPMPVKKSLPPQDIEIDEEDEIDKELEDEIDDILSELENAGETPPKEEKRPLPVEQAAPAENLDDEEEILEIEDDLLEPDHKSEEVIEDKPNYLSDPREKRRPAADRPRYEKPYNTTSSEPPKPSFLSTLVVAGLLLYVGNYLLYKITGYKIFGSSSQEYAIEESGSSETVVAKATDGIESFPNLPAGMYQGTIYDVIPGEDAKLVVISLPEQNSLVFIAAIEGWSPSVSALPPAKNGAPSKSIRVTSNGIVLDMQGEVVDGVVEGVYSNALNGIKGKWQLKPFNK